MKSTTQAFSAALIAVFCGVLFFYCDISAQNRIPRYAIGKSSFEYLFAFPMPGIWSSEKPRGNPIRIQIISKTAGEVTVAGPGVNQTVMVEPNVMKEVNFQSADKTLSISDEHGDRAFRVVSSVPLQVYGYMTWAGTGEKFLVPEVSELGTDYYTLNLWQDWIGRTPNLFSGFIAIVSNENENVVSITPACNTRNHKAKETFQIRLQRNQCYYILADTALGLTQMKATDLTGSHIASTRPIVVLSGHEKCASPQFPALLAGADGHFMRNCLIEVMPPTSSLGTEFVTGPLRYTARTRKIWPNDDGDLFRFVASQDGTQLTKTDVNGNAYKVGPVLKAGEYYEANESENVRATVFRANKPMLAGHYGKSWLEQYLRAEEKSGESAQGHPIVKCGQGALQTILPTERWTSNARFNCDPDLDNWLLVVFRSSEVNKIRYDGSPLNSVFGASIKLVPGTVFSYSAQKIKPGNHVMTTTEPLVKFWASSYGNLDGLQEAIGYASTANVTVSKSLTDCLDTIAVSQLMDCKKLTIRAKKVSVNNCSSDRLSVQVTSIHSDLYISIDRSTSDVSIVVTSLSTDAKKTFTGSINFCNSNEECVTVPFRLAPFSDAGAESVSLGIRNVGEVVNFPARIVNQNPFPSTVSEFTHPNGAINISTSEKFPLMLTAGESRTVAMTLTTPNPGRYVDTLYFPTICGGLFYAPLSFESQGQVGIDDELDPMRDIVVKYTNGNISVALGNGEQVEKMELFDMMGQRMEMKNNFNREATLSAKGLATGAYYVRITTTKWVVSVPVMIQE